MSAARYITCQQLIDTLDAYVDGTMPQAERAEVDRHLAVCPDCVNYVNNYRQTIAMGKSVFKDPRAPVPTDVPTDLVNAILAAAKKR
jgi:anti-sigma factor RsiW